MLFAPRILLILGLIGAAVGVFFGAKGALIAHEAVSEVNRKGGDADSLFRADRLAGALDKVRAEVGADGKLLELTIYPGYMMVEASTGSEDSGRSFKVQGNGEVVAERPLTLTGPGRLADNVFPLAKLDAAAIERVARAAAAKEHATLDDLSHIIATVQPDSGRAGLNVYLRNSRYWRAALDGSGLSNPTADARAAIDDAGDAVAAGQASGRAAAKATNRAGDLAACVQAACTDVAKLQACSG